MSNNNISNGIDPQNNNNRPMPKHTSLGTSKVVLISALVFFFITLAAVFPMMLSGADKTVIIRIPQNATMTDIKDTLKKYTGDSYTSRILRLMKIRNVDMTRRHGQFEIEKGDSPFTAMRKLTSGGQHPVSITINGFRDSNQMAERIARKLELTPQELIEAMNDSATLAPYNLEPGQALALFLNDTYSVYWTATPKELIEKIGNNYTSVWNTFRRKLASDLNLTPLQVTILASIVDEETNKRSEKGTIARLYLNRLARGMKLQSDPTVRFALQDFTIKRVLEKHLEVNSPFNTYKNFGLPPAPIRTTSVETIDAILKSEPNDYLYMCAREDFSGFHNFASTYEEHLKNAKKYHQTLNEKDILQ